MSHTVSLLLTVHISIRTQLLEVEIFDAWIRLFANPVTLYVYAYIREGPYIGNFDEES